MLRSCFFVFAISCCLSASVFGLSPAKDKAQICPAHADNLAVEDCEALIDFYNAAQGISSCILSWGDDNLANWERVTISDGRVTELIVSDCMLKGEIPESVFRLTKLKSLSFQSNFFSGPIPSSISSLKELEYLDLGRNKLTGSLPDALSELRDIGGIFLTSNNFTGSIPRSLGLLKNISAFDVSRNNLSGDIPADFFQGTNITYFDVSRNRLTGSIPSAIFSGNRGKHINLARNNFSGELPKELSTVPTGSSIIFSYNNLTGSLPSNLQELKANNSLLTFDNNKFSGSIPNHVDPANFSEFRDKTLNLENNQLSGAIPEYVFSSYETVVLKNNQLSGEIPQDFSKAGAENLSTIDLSHNNLSGEIPQLDNYPNEIEKLDLSYNKLSGDFRRVWKEGHITYHEADLSHNKFDVVIDGALKFPYGAIDLSYNKISGHITSFGLSESGSVSIDISHNLLTGDSLTFVSPFAPGPVNLSYNKFYGVVPNSEVWCSGATNGITLDLSNNQFRGELKKSNFLSCRDITVDVSNNRLHGDIADVKNYVSNEAGGTLIADNQKPYQIHPSSRAVVEKLYGDQSSNHVYNISVPPGQKLVEVIGCPGNLRGNIFKLVGGQEACDWQPVFSACSGPIECLSDFGSASGIQNARIESPASAAVVSGVVQFRGWLHEEEMRRYKVYDARNPRKAKLLIDGSQIPLDINFNRLDVASAMGYSEENQIPVGWSALFYAGNLSNGPHTATLVSNEGAIVDTLSFSSFTLQDEEGKAAYITGNQRESLVEDFPYKGSDLVARFNSSEQSFSIIDQLNSEGNSTRSAIVHYSEDQLTPQNTGVINGIAQVKIETPNSESDLLGVASLRGWAYGSELLNGPLYMSLDDGELFLLPRGERSDVEQAMGVNTSIKVGWSQLFYAGNLENGRHRLRLYGDQGGNKVLLAESYFESFVPLDERGKPIYIQADKTVELRDFPFDGSIVELRFDKAGQNFVPVSQFVH